MELRARVGVASACLTLAGLGMALIFQFGDPSLIPEAWHPWLVPLGVALFAIGILGAISAFVRVPTQLRRLWSMLLLNQLAPWASWTTRGFTWSSHDAGGREDASAISLRIRPAVEVQPIDFLVEYESIGESPVFWATLNSGGEVAGSWSSTSGDRHIRVHGNCLRLTVPEPALRPGDTLSIFVLSPGQSKPKRVRRRT